jgi:hypothetical protein
MNYTKRGSAAGTLIIDGGMKTGIAGIPNAIGMTTIMIATAITTSTESSSFGKIGGRARFRALLLSIVPHPNAVLST